MRLTARRTAGRILAALLVPLSLAGCTETVANPISPEDARRQVVDVSRQVIADLGAEIAEAKFGYSSCNDYGTPPFRANSRLKLWMPGADRTREVSPESVLGRLRQRGWQTDPDFHSHAPTFKRDDVDVSVTVIPPPQPGQPPTAHVMIEVLGECRDTFDHRDDKTDRLSTDITGELTGD